jgi:hypothetical protein
MNEKGFEFGEVPPQRELKGYTKTTEVWIPVLQMLVIMLAGDAVAGLLVYVGVWIGPEFWRVTLAALLFVGTVVLTLALRNQHGRVAVFAVGAAAFTAWMVNVDKLLPLWPWDWLWERFWQPWRYTAWLGPVLGCGLIIWRFANELRDPFWPRIPFLGEQKKEPPKVVLRDRPVFVRSNDKKAEWKAPAVIERDQNQEVEEDTFYDDMYEFIVRAFTRGIERSNWFGPDLARFRFPSGQYLSKSYFNYLVNMLVESGHANWDGPGTAKYFACPIETVMRDWGLFTRWDEEGRPGSPSPSGRAGRPAGGRETSPTIARSQRDRE